MPSSGKAGDLPPNFAPFDGEASSSSRRGRGRATGRVFPTVCKPHKRMLVDVRQRKSPVSLGRTRLPGWFRTLANV